MKSITKNDLDGSVSMSKKVNLGRGHKLCPKCEKAVGPRTIKCECGHLFFSKKKNKVQKVSSKKTIKKAGKGHKNCPDCGAILWANTHVCKCGYQFKIKSKKVAKARKTVARKETIKIGIGRKQCPSCKTITAARSNFCSSCGFQFVTKPGRKFVRKVGTITGGRHHTRVA